MTTQTPQLADALKTAFDLGRMGAATIPSPDGGIVAFVPAGTQKIDLRPAEPLLLRIEQSATFHDRDSFVAYVNRYRTDRTRLFAEPGFLSGHGAQVLAVLDYHEASGTPQHGVHRATYKPRYSDHWQRWQKAAASTMKQAEFAEFIEEHRGDIRVPSAAQLLDVVRAFKASKKTEFDSVVYQPNGDVMLAYDERTTQTGKSGALPEHMELGIPVYFRGTVYAVPVWLRFKVGSGAVAFQIKLDRADLIEDAAFQEITSKVQEATGIEVYLGRPA